MPDFCTGFLYVTKPSVGAALAQAGLEMFGDSEDIVITEDYLIAGVLRQRLGQVEVESLESDPWVKSCPRALRSRTTMVSPGA